MSDKFKEECGVFGIYGHTEAANLDLPRPLRAAASRPGKRRHRDLRRRAAADLTRRWATSPTTSTRRRSRSCAGTSAVGHVRYSTAGESGLKNAQPILIDCAHGELRSATTAISSTRRSCATSSSAQGSIFQTTSDTEVLLHLYARSKAPTRRAGDRRIGLAGAGRVFARAADEGSADRRARSARLPAADARPPWRCLYRLLRDLRARSD